MTAPWYLCALFVAAVYVYLPLDAWRCAWPSAVRDRNRRIEESAR